MHGKADLLHMRNFPSIRYTGVVEGREEGTDEVKWGGGTDTGTKGTDGVGRQMG
jgi:hypothetical protein